MNTLRTAVVAGISAAIATSGCGGTRQPVERVQAMPSPQLLEQQETLRAKRINAIAAAAATDFTKRLIAESQDVERKTKIEPIGTAIDFDDKGTNKLTMYSKSRSPKIGKCAVSRFVGVRARYRDNGQIQATRFAVDASESFSGEECALDGTSTQKTFWLGADYHGQWFAKEINDTYGKKSDDITTSQRELTSPSKVQDMIGLMENSFKEFVNPQ